MTPIIFSWTGDSMVPFGRFAKLCDRLFVVGEKYRMEAIEERSAASHRHYFACIHDAWINLPESIAERFPTEEHLRKRALIDAGYCDEEIIDCVSNKVAATVAGAIRKRDDFALIFVRDQFVIIRTAKSQSIKAMGAKIFQESKSKVLDIIEGMIGVARGALTKETA